MSLYNFESLYLDKLVNIKIFNSFVDNFLIYISLFIDDYNKNRGFIKIIYDNLNNKKIIIYMITRLNGVKKIIIIPYKYNIIIDNYSYNYQSKNFTESFLKILYDNSININSIVNIIHYNTSNTNIKIFNNYSDRL